MCRIAIRASRAPGWRREALAYEGGRTALLFSPGDHEALARLTLRLLDDVPLRSRLERNAMDDACLICIEG